MCLNVWKVCTKYLIPFCMKELNYKLKNPLGNAMGEPKDNMEAKESKAYEMI